MHGRVVSIPSAVHDPEQTSRSIVVPRMQLPPRRPRRYDEYDSMRNSQKQSVYHVTSKGAGNQGERTSVGPEPIRRTFQ
jgi:hypothetical protein